MNRALFGLIAVLVAGIASVAGIALRESKSDRNRAAFHQVQAPKVREHFNTMFGLKLGAKNHEDSFYSASSSVSMYMVEHQLFCDGEPCGTITALGTSENSNIVSLRYVLDRKVIQKSEALETISQLKPNLIYNFGEYKVRFDPDSEESQCVIFISPSEDAVEQLMASGKLPSLPGKNEL
ncbi:MAG: hypothetical protein J0L72_11195 [Armatimonadetes bacterium]|nr:hypothetical protein [Armatimonadota bacterium]